jgi:phosphate transport system protein
MNSELHTSKQYDAELEQVHSQVVLMGRLVERQLAYATEAFRRRDLVLAERVAVAEPEINALEVSIDELCTTVIARRQPNSNDLRLIMMVLKTITDLERIGDEAKKIGLVTSRIFGPSARHVPRITEVIPAAELVGDMLHRSLEAFGSLEIGDAPGIARQDIEVDEHFQSILRQLLTYMIEDPRTISASLDIIFLAKSLERIGDHAKNISEYVVYMIKGKDVRHVTVEEMEQAVKS